MVPSAKWERVVSYYSTLLVSLLKICKTYLYFLQKTWQSILLSAISVCGNSINIFDRRILFKTDAISSFHFSSPNFFVRMQNVSTVCGWNRARSAGEKRGWRDELFLTLPIIQSFLFIFKKSGRRTYLKLQKSVTCCNVMCIIYLSTRHLIFQHDFCCSCDIARYWKMCTQGASGQTCPMCVYKYIIYLTTNQHYYLTKPYFSLVE